MEGNTPAPHLGAVLMGHAAAEQGLELRGAHQVSVHGAGQIVLPLDPDGHLLVRHGEGLQLQSSHLRDQPLLLFLLLWDRLEAIRVVLTDVKLGKRENDHQYVQFIPKVINTFRGTLICFTCLNF